MRSFARSSTRSSKRFSSGRFEFDVDDVAPAAAVAPGAPSKPGTRVTVVCEENDCEFVEAVAPDPLLEELDELREGSTAAMSASTRTGWLVFMPARSAIRWTMRPQPF